MNLDTVIGLEVHVQLDTATKLFCSCRVAFGEAPNENVCPVCTGQPGALPRLNERALERALLASLALKCTIPEKTKFDRKNYFYPDLPKGYQVSQLDRPVGLGGGLDIPQKRVRLTRVHLEEDAGKNVHRPGGQGSLVDLNRAGVPLIEIVSEPDMGNADEAVAYLESLRRLMRYLGVSECDMEKGSLRCDVNISVRENDEAPLGVKVEVKNLNSFKNVRKAIELEQERQTRAWKDGIPIIQETRSFRADEGITVSMRTKEEADDYRYFPEPDLPEFAVSPTVIRDLQAQIPEYPLARLERYRDELGLSEYDAALLSNERDLAEFFDGCVNEGLQAKAAANWIQSEILKTLNERKISIGELGLTPRRLAEIGALVEKKTISHTAGVQVLHDVLKQDRDPEAVAKELDLIQVSDTGELESLVDTVLEGAPDVVADYRAGKRAALNALLGQVMKQTKGKANPQLVREILAEKLG